MQDATTCKTAIEEIAPYLVGKGLRRVAHHWQAVYRYTFVGVYSQFSLSGTSIIKRGIPERAFCHQGGVVEIPKTSGLGIELDEIN